VRVTYNAVDARFSPPVSLAAASARAAALLGSAAPYYLLVGKNEPYKGHRVAVEAFAKSARDDERLVLIQRASGGRGLLQLAARLGVAERVQLLPAVTGHDLVCLLQAARALLQPSLVEGFGIPVLEAMACGCPVVASDTPALLEVSGGAALHAAVGDASALAAAITRLRGLDREQLRANGLARAARFSWERTTSETLAIYREAAGERARSAA
jgi:glycosyltransferase involved in cell wall biosynthesis